MPKYYRNRSEHTIVKDVLYPRDIPLLTTPVELTIEESQVYQKLRSDKLIKLKDLRQMFGVDENTMPVAFILSMDVPIYRIGDQRGNYYVFSSDVVKAFTRLRIPSGVKFKRRLLELAGYRDYIRRGSVKKRRANGSGTKERVRKNQEEVLEESGRRDESDDQSSPRGRKRGRKAESLQQDLGRVLGSWKDRRDSARFSANIERNPHGPGTGDGGEGGRKS